MGRKEDIATIEDRERHYTALGHSVDLIDSILSQAEVPGVDYSERHDTCRRNVQHLEVMLEKDFWDGEDMTDIRRAIAAGNEMLRKPNDL